MRLTRTSCVICNSEKLIQFLSIESFPVYMGVTEQQIEDDLYMDQNWAICDSCNVIQLIDLVPIDILYSDNHFYPIGSLWENHHKQFAEFIIKNSSSDSVAEVGGGSGILSKILMSSRDYLSYKIIEPSQKADISGVIWIQDFIENSFDHISNKDLIIHSHVLEHLYTPREVISKISERMSNNSRMIFSIPNIKSLIRGVGANSLNFEHSFYIDLDVVKFLLEANGIEIISIQYFENHSIFIAAEKTGISISDIQPKFIDMKQQMIFLWSKINEISQKYNEEVNTSGSPGYIFGGHVFAQAISYFNDNNTVAILDHDTRKHNKRLYGTGLEVLDPEIIRNKNKPVIALLASAYQQQIKESLLSINPECIIIE